MFETLDPTAHFQQSGSGLRQNVEAADNDNNNKNEREEFLPIIRVLGEERREIRNLGIERLVLRLQFWSPPDLVENNISDYNRILSEWLNRAFTTLLSAAN